MRSGAVAIPLAAAVLVAAVFGAFELGPTIEPRQRLPHDVADLTWSSWRAFETAFPAQVGCLVDVELELVRDVRDGAARYDAAEHLVRVEIPTSPRRYVESLVHELAHHLDAVCGGEEAIGSAFREAQGIPPEVPWGGGEAWEERPMEHFAEAVVEYVTGDRYTHADIIDISDRAVAIVEQWAGRGR